MLYCVRLKFVDVLYIYSIAKQFLVLYGLLRELVKERTIQCVYCVFMSGWGGGAWTCRYSIVLIKYVAVK